MAKVSILLPVNGSSEFLEESIESIRGQSFKDFELIVITDRASHISHRLIDKFSRVDKRIVKIQSHSEGLANALNTGLEFSSAPLICRLDDDDVMFQDRLLLQIRALERDSGIVCIGSQVVFFGNGLTPSTSRLPLTNWQIRAEAMFFNPLAHPSLMLRKDALESLSGYDSLFKYAQDYELISRLLAKGKIKNLPYPLTAYRIHQNQITMRATGQERLPYELAALASIQTSNKEKSFSDEKLQKYKSCRIPEDCFTRDADLNPGIARATVTLRKLEQSASWIVKVQSVLTAVGAAPKTTLRFLFSKLMSMTSASAMSFYSHLFSNYHKNSGSDANWNRILGRGSKP